MDMTTTHIIGVCFIFALLVLMIIALYINIHYQKKDYNNSKCPICGEHLKLRNYGKNGNRQYTCDKCNYSCWISWKFIDKKY